MVSFSPLRVPPICSTIAAPLRNSQPARGADRRDLGVLWGYGTRDELETAGANRLVDSPADLARTVLSMVDGEGLRLQGQNP